MKICYLSDAGSVHTKKWCEHMLRRGHEVDVISFRDADIPGARVYDLNETDFKTRSDLQKLRYITHIREVRRLVRNLRPDFVHAHYLTSYGLMGALSGYRPMIVSVWGTDIQEFPKKSPLHEAVVRYNLSRADAVWATSRALAERTRPYTQKEISITPFGVDMSVFRPLPADNHEEYVIGTVKALEPRYGIDYLIRAFALVKKRNPLPSLKLEIAGIGTREQELRALAGELGVGEDTRFLGYLASPEEVTKTYNRFEFAVFPSLEEAFGVSAVEAQACGTPTIITDVGGLPEATLPGVTSLLVPPKDPQALASAMEELLHNEPKRSAMAENSRAYVQAHFDVEDTFDRIEALYEEFLRNHTAGRRR